MKDTPLLQGQLVRLVAPDIENTAGLFARWMQDSEYGQMLDSEPPRLFSPEQVQKWLEKHLKDNQHDTFLFLIHSLTDDRPIGFVELDGVQWTHRNTFLGIAIGERELWNQGYGTDAMRVILRYGFTELNLHRVSLNVFEYNARALRVYEKLGFVEEGRLREFVQREGRRWDFIFMGILRDEWEQRET